MRKLTVRIVKYSLILLVVLSLILLVAPFFIDVNDYKQTIIDKAEQATGRQITVGSMHLSLFPWVGVRLEDVHVKNRPGFSAQDFVSTKSLDVQVDLLPLLNKHIVVKRFELDAPHVSLERNAHGEDSWADLMPRKHASGGAAAPSSGAGGGKSDSKATPAAGGLVALSARTLHIQNGEFLYRDDVSGRAVVLNQLRLDVDHVQTEQPIGISASGSLDGNAFRIDGRVGPLGDIARLDVTHLPMQLRLQADGVALSRFRAYLPALEKLGSATLSVDAQFEQRPDGVRLSAGGMEIAAGHRFGIDWKAEMPSIDSVEVQSMKLRLDDRAMGDASGEVKGLGDKPHYQLRAKLEPLSREVIASWLPSVRAMYAGHPNPWKQISVGLLATGDAAHVELRDLQLRLDDDVVQASGAIGFAGAPDIRLRILSKALHVDPWLPQPQQNGAAAPAGAEGGASTPANSSSVSSTTASTTAVAPPQTAAPATSANSATTGDGAPVGAEQPSSPTTTVAASEQPQDAGPAKEPDLRFLRTWHVNTQIQVNNLFLHGLAMKNLRASVQGSDGRFSMDPLQFDLSGGRVRETASLSVRTYPARWTESVHISDVQVNPVLRALAGTDMLSGIMQMETQLQGRGLLPEMATATLSGKGKVQVRDGAIKGIDIPGTLRRLTAAGQQQGEKKTDFSQLSASFKVNRGRVTNDDLFMASPLFRLTGQGQIDLASKTLDYHLKPRLVGSLIGQGDTEAVRRGLVVPLHVVGPLEKPKVRVEVDPATLIQNVETLKGVIKQLKKKPDAGTTREEQIKKTLKQFLPMLQ